MITRQKLHRRLTSRQDSASSRSLCRIESLEQRTLLSAWSTVDSQPSENSGVTAMTTDKAGNVYAVGDIIDSKGEDFVIREKPSNSSSWTTLYGFGNPVQWETYLSGIAVDAKGDVFVSGSGAAASWTLWELPQGSSSPVVIDTSPGGVSDVAIDPAGNVYETGHLVVSVKNTLQDQWNVRKGTFNSATGTWTFGVVDHLATQSGAGSLAIVTTTSGGVSSTAVYVAGQVGSVGSSWVVRKSVNGGPWSQVDSFRYDSTANASSWPNGIAADLAGNVYVAGIGQKATITGYNKNKTPIYSFINHWIVRKSTNGGTSWSTDDDASYLGNNNEPVDICVNPQNGTMDVAGYMYDTANISHAIVRSNAGGTWSTVDNYTGNVLYGGSYYAITADAAGNVYAGGGDYADNGGWLIRSQPAAPTSLVASIDPVLPSSQIDLAWANQAGSDGTGFAIYRSTDGVTFTLLDTVDATATSYTDGGLSPGTKYYYYVVTLLNSDGASAPSGTVSATTTSV